HVQIVQAPLSRGKPVELEPCLGGVALDLLQKAAAPLAKQLAVALLVQRVAEVQSPKQRIGGELRRWRNVAASVRLRLREAKQLRGPAFRAQPNPSVHRAKQSVHQRRLNGAHENPRGRINS